MEEELNKTIENLKQHGLDAQEFERSKRKVYGDYVTEYNSVGDIARMFLADAMKGIFSFDYIEKYETVTKEYTEEILKNIFNKKIKFYPLWSQMKLNFIKKEINEKCNFSTNNNEKSRNTSIMTKKVEKCHTKKLLKYYKISKKSLTNL